MQHSPEPVIVWVALVQLIRLGTAEVVSSVEGRGSAIRNVTVCVSRPVMERCYCFLHCSSLDPVVKASYCLRNDLVGTQARIGDLDKVLVLAGEHNHALLYVFDDSSDVVEFRLLCSEQSLNLVG